MMLMPFLLLVVAADEPRPDCDNPRYQVEMNYCAGEEYEAADAALNAQWQHTAATLKEADTHIDRSYDSQPTHYETALAAQRAWLTYRDQHCLSESFAARGGSMQPMLRSGCMARLTIERTEQLKTLAEEY